jgi:hypothetical protein
VSRVRRSGEPTGQTMVIVNVSVSVAPTASVASSVNV